MLKKVICGFASGLVVSWAASTTASTIVIDDQFDDGALGTNTTGVGTGFGRVNNGPGAGAGGAVGESGGLATATATNPLANVGVVSSDTFDPGSVPGFSVTWEIDAVNVTGTFNRVELLVQGGTSFRNTPFWELQLVNNNSTTAPTDWEVRVDDGPSSDATVLTGDFGGGQLDGFTVTASFDADGYSITSTGLTNAINVVDQAWTAAFDYDDFDATSNVAAMIQQFSQGPADSLVVDRITVTLIPEPGSLALLSLGGLMLVRRRK